MKDYVFSCAYCLKPLPEERNREINDLVEEKKSNTILRPSTTYVFCSRQCQKDHEREINHGEVCLVRKLRRRTQSSKT